MSSGLSPVNAVLSFPAAGYFAVQKVREKAYGWGASVAAQGASAGDIGR